jgi:hypothetical protein
MKKSRIFLAATLALGIAGAVAAKAHTASVQYKYIDPNLGTCVTGTFNSDPCPTSGTIDCKTTIGTTSNVQLFTLSGTCLTSQKIQRQ